jgi:hypothetical protein
MDLVLTSVALAYKTYRVPASKVLFYLPQTSDGLLRGRSLPGYGSVLCPGEAAARVWSTREFLGGTETIAYAAHHPFTLAGLTSSIF